MRQKVLIVEDDKNLSESLKNLCIRKNMDVKLSFSGQQAENIITLEQYDLLLIDVILPKLNGLELIRQIISKGLIPSHCKIWLISGVLKKNIVSADIMGHVDEFIEKPINPHSIEKKLDNVFTKPQNLLKKLPFFYSNWQTLKNNFLKNQEYIIKGHELMFICIYLYITRFNGMLSVHHYNKNQRDEILFYDGQIRSFKTEDKTSYLGDLLIKNNLISKEELQKILSKKTNKPLGDELMSACDISPHQLKRVLKEQLAIRLFKTMGQSSISVSCQNFTVSREFNQFVDLEIKDYLSLINNWIHAKVTVKWLKGFFKSCENLRLVPLDNVIPKEHLTRYSKMDFFSQSIQSPMLISEFLASRDEIEGMRELYCRLLVRGLVIDNTNMENKTSNSYEFMEKKYKTFLADSNKKTYFELMNLPVNAPIQKVEEVYKNMVKIFHPDRRSKDMPKHLVEICDQCFILVRKIHQTLTDPAKRQVYTRKIGDGTNKHDFSTKEMYMKGRKNLKEGRHKEALSQFESIYKEKTVPGDAILYYISAKLKNLTTPSTKEKEQIAQLFDRVSLEHRHSALFYFSKGLLKKLEGDKKMAFDLFTKAVLLDPQLHLARMERHALGLSKKKKDLSKPSSLFSFFKKGA